MLGIFSTRFTVRVAIATRNTGLVSSSRSDQSAFSQTERRRLVEGAVGSTFGS